MLHAENDDIEKLGMGLGTRLILYTLDLGDNFHIIMFVVKTIIYMYIKHVEAFTLA